MVNKCKNIVLVSLSSAGTEGHLSVIKNLFGHFKNKGFYPIVISESDYAGFFPPECFLKLKQVGNKSELSLGGAIDSTYDLQLARFLNQIKPKIVIFETFFNPSLIKNIKYPCYFVGCKFRDTHQELFFKKRFFSLFKKVYFMEEAFEVFKTKEVLLRIDKVFKNVYYCLPILSISDEKLSVSKREKIIVTCGGGGLHSANKILLTANEVLYNMNLGIHSEVTYITGLFNQNQHELLLSRKSRQYTHIKDLSKDFKKSYLVISEAGYNTVNELVATDTPALLIPGFRALDNQELRAINSDIFGFDLIFPEYLKPDCFKKKIKTLFKRKLSNSNRLAVSKFLFKGKNILFESLRAEADKQIER